MHISDMLNPESHSDKVYSSTLEARTRTQNTATPNIPRSAPLPALTTAHISSTSSTYSYSYGNTISPRSHVASGFSHRHNGDMAPQMFFSHRNTLAGPGVVSSAGESSHEHLLSDERTKVSPLTVTATRPVLIHSTTQGLYTHAQPPETDSLATLATLAASQDSRDQDIHRYRSWSQTIGVAYREPRKDSHQISPRDTAAVFDAFHSPFTSAAGKRTVSVGSQTSRSNTPETKDAPVVRTKSTGICTGSARLPSNSTLNRPSSAAPRVSQIADAVPDSPSLDTLKSDDDHKCSYTDSCETGSPLRKVVSHFFGRNKLATRKIPKNLWVYFCRKHYQRSRYRNPRGFACLQIQLVQTQIGNLRRWGGVIDWTVKVRRREELRTKTTGEPASGKNVTRRRTSGNGSSIPNHYMQYVGEHRSMDEVTALVEAIQQDMEQNGGTFPDLELLPRVMAEVSPSEREDELNERGKGKKVRVARTRQVQAKRRRGGTTVSERGAAPTTATEYTNMAVANRSASHNISEVIAISRSSNLISHTGGPTNNIPKRTLEGGYKEVPEGIRPNFRQELTAPVIRPIGFPESPTKRRRLSHEMDSHSQCQETFIHCQDPQIVTPPESDPSVSRRTSLAAECVSPLSCSAHVLEGVHAALQTVQVASGADMSSRVAA